LTVKPIETAPNGLQKCLAPQKALFLDVKSVTWPVRYCGLSYLFDSKSQATQQQLLTNRDTPDAKRHSLRQKSSAVFSRKLAAENRKKILFIYVICAASHRWWC
jgi:hypothetical protein